MLQRAKLALKKEVVETPEIGVATIPQVAPPDAAALDTVVKTHNESPADTCVERTSSLHSLDKALTPDVDEKHQTSSDTNNDTEEYPQGFKLYSVLCVTILSVFLVALDQTILSVAIPKITDRFGAIEDIAWYVSAYMVTTCALIPTFGKIYQTFSVKYTYLTAIFLFELGSAVCGAAPSSKALIVGRAIAGCGTAGIFSGALIILSRMLPLEKRAPAMGGFAASFGISSVCGPLMGGAFTESHLTWRWCFYINLPIGAVVMGVVFLFVNIKNTRQGLTFKQKIQNLDPFGASILLPAVVSLLLALQWGGSKYPWSNGRVIGCFVVFGVLIIAFVASQFYLGEQGTIPPRIIKKRSMWAAALVAVFFAGFFFQMVTYIPIYFQAIRGSSAIKAGIQLLPFMISVVVSSMVGGFLVQAIGWYTPILIVGIIPTTIGVGLISTWQVDTPSRLWIAYQIIAGMGAGAAFQIPIIASQAVLDPDDIPVGSSIITFAQNLGGAIIVTVGQNLFQNTLERHLTEDLRNPQLVGQVLASGATGFRSFIPQGSAQYAIVQSAYMHAIRAPFHTAVVSICIAFVWACCLEWKNIKGKKMDHAAAA